MYTSFTILSILLPLVVTGDSSCKEGSCWSKGSDGEWHYDWKLTDYTCTKHTYPEAVYNSKTGRCTVYPDQAFDTSSWDALCKRVGTVDGFYDVLSNGINYQAPAQFVADAYGHCDLAYWGK